MSNNYNITLQSNNTDLQTVLQTLQTKAAGQQATPTISVNSSGLITATAGTKSSTHQLAFQAAKTITPTAASQIAVSSGYYTGGNITVAGDSNLVAGNIKSGVSIFGVMGVAEVNEVSIFTYTVDSIDGASFGFGKNSNGYYESQNKGVNSSYAICRVNIVVNTACDIVFDVINYAENNYDYGIFGNLDKSLNLSNAADSSSYVKKNFKGLNSSLVTKVTYDGVTVGNHFIDIKFIKDSSGDSYNDSVQFKILAGEDKTVEPSIEDALVSRTLTKYTNETVKAIGDYAFYSNQGITEVSFPIATTIGGSAFLNCDSLSSISFPKVMTIGNAAFCGCTSLNNVNFPAATTIGDGAFKQCSNLYSVSFPVASYIPSSAFSCCSGLRLVNFPLASVIYINAFMSCYALYSINFQAVKTIGYGAFLHCKGLSIVNFPVASVIDTSAFTSCTKLVSTSFPAVLTIDSYAFNSCTSIATLSFPAAKFISNSAFRGCNKLSQIYLMASSVCTLSNSYAFANTSIGSNMGSIYVPSSLVTSYKSATNWTYFSNRIFGV